MNTKTVLWLLVGLSGILAASASELQVQGGAFWVQGEIQSYAVRVESGATLGGTGLVRAGQVDMAGSVAPGVNPGTVGSLGFSSNLIFQGGALYPCDIATSTSVDRLDIRGSSTGPGTVLVSNPSGSIPVDQVIIAGGAASSYAGFSTGGTGSTNWGLVEKPLTDLSLTRLDGDSDGDGLPDWWELAYSGHRTGMDPNGHGDSDTVPNSSEFAALTDPTNSGSYLHLTRMESVTSGWVRVAWQSVPSPWLNLPAPSYRVDATSNLMTGSLAALSGDLASTPPENVYTSAAPQALQFYRVTRR